jgi:uncharacterized protein (DUF885 family)
MKKVILWTLVVLVAAAGVFLVPVIWLKPWTPDMFYARIFFSFALRHPLVLTQMGMFENTPLRWYADELDDMSPAAEQREAKFLDDNLAMLKSYDRSKMSKPAALSAEVLEWFLDDQQRANSQFMYYDYPVNQLFGVQNQLPTFMVSTQPLKKERDARAYVGRVSKIGRAIDESIEGLTVREEKGVIPPRFVLERVIKEMNGFVSPPADSNVLVQHFRTNLDSIQGLEKKRGEALLAELSAAVDGKVYPAYRRMIAKCEALAAKTTDDDGVWKLPNGDAYYDQMLRHHTTSDLPADSIHALGLHEVARIQADMKALLQQKGIHSSSFAADVHRLKDDPRFSYGEGEEGRARILARYQEVLDEASVRCDSLFGVRPKAKLEVKRVPEFKEATTPGAYYGGPSLDGVRPGVFYVNLRDPKETYRPDTRTLAYHEGVPGHHFQISVQTELKGVPFFRRVIPFTAYAEGWALYAERLALEEGFHQDAEDSLGAMGAELFRAVRLVVDTGIHRKRWTRQQAIDYMTANTGMDTSEVVTEIERYIVSPGQACAYKVGQLEILALRDRAKERLGARFDLRKFHDTVLTCGSVPLTVLEEVVNAWIEEQERAAGAKSAG